MAFVFSLEPILKLRRSQERAELLKLEGIVAQQRQIGVRLRELDEAHVLSQKQLREELVASVDGAELEFHDFCESSRKLVRANLQQQLVNLEQERLAQVQALLQIRHSRELFESIRNRQSADYDLILARKEQQAQDDMFLMKRWGDGTASG